MIKCSNKKCRAPVERYGYCRECSAVYRKQWVASRPGYDLVKRREWEKRNPERVQELYRQKLERDKEKYRLKVEATGRKVGERPPALTPSERQRRHFEKNPVRAAAMKIYKYAIRHGQLVRGPCAVCGTTEGIDGHHTDYTKPLNVVWLCKPHHREEHKRIRCEAA